MLERPKTSLDGLDVDTYSRGLRKRWLLVGMACVVVAACATFDAGGSPPDATDGGTDVDADLSDAAADALGPSDASTTPCAIPNSHLMCADFNGTSLIEQFDRLITDDAAAAIHLDDAASFSPFGSALATVAANDGGQHYATLGRRFFQVAPTIQLAFMLQLVTPGTHDIEVADLDLSSSASTSIYTLPIHLRQQTLYVGEYVPVDGSYAYVPHDTERVDISGMTGWVSVVLTVGVAVPSVAFSVRDMTSFSASQFAVAPAPSPADLTVGVRVGVTQAIGPMPAVTYRIDDVTLDAH